MIMSDAIGLELERRERAVNDKKLYATLEERDPMGLDEDGGFYSKHVMAMTVEKLHSKAKIAAELGHRDRVIATQQARIEALEKLLDPETLARKIGDWDFAHNSDYFCFKFGGDGDNGEMLIDALAALLEAEK